MVYAFTQDVPIGPDLYRRIIENFLDSLRVIYPHLPVVVLGAVYTTLDVFDIVPPGLKESAYGLGCTTWEVVRNIVLPYTKVGVIGLGTMGAGIAEAFAGAAAMAISSLVITRAVLGRFDCRCCRANSPRDSCAPALLTMVKAATKATAKSVKVRLIEVLSPEPAGCSRFQSSGNIVAPLDAILAKDSVSEALR